jgi:hypothetical protein
MTRIRTARQLSFKLPPITKPDNIPNIITEFHWLREYWMWLAARIMNITGCASIEFNWLRDYWIWPVQRILNLIRCVSIEFDWPREYWISLAARILNSFRCESTEFNRLREYWIQLVGECSVLVYIPVIYAPIYNAQSFQPFTQPGIRKSSTFHSTELTGIFLWVWVFIVSLSLLLGKPLLCNQFSTDLIKGFAVYL